MQDGDPDRAGLPQAFVEQGRGTNILGKVPGPCAPRKTALQGAGFQLVLQPCLIYPVRMHVCHFCAAPIADPREVFRTSTCPSCGRDLKICLNCRFYSPGAHWDCAESVDELVQDKDRANFCTFFAFRNAKPGQKGAARPDATSQARKKLDKLFGNDS